MNDILDNEFGIRPGRMYIAVETLREILNTLPDVPTDNSVHWNDDLLLWYDPERGGLELVHNDWKAHRVMGGPYGFIDFDTETLTRYEPNIALRDAARMQYCTPPSKQQETNDDQLGGMPHHGFFRYVHEI